MKSLIFKFVGCAIFMAIALGSGTSSQVIRVQDELTKNGRWLLVYVVDNRNVWMDPYSLIQTTSGYWSFYHMTALIESPQNSRLGPNQINLNCINRTYEELLLQGDGNQLTSTGFKAYPVGTKFEVLASAICGLQHEVERQMYYLLGYDVSQNGYFVKDNEVFVTSDPNIRKMYYRMQDEKTRGTSVLGTMLVDCTNKRIKSVDEKGVVLLDWANVTGVDLAIGSIAWDRACNDQRSFMKKMSDDSRVNQTVSPPRQLSQADLDGLTCQKYGFKPNSDGLAQCVMQIAFARREAQQKYAVYIEQKRQYDAQVAAIEAERKRRQSAAAFEFGLRMMGGQTPVDAMLSTGTGAPIRPPVPPSSTSTYMLPGNRMMNCTTTGPMTSCF